MVVAHPAVAEDLVRQAASTRDQADLVSPFVQRGQCFGSGASCVCRARHQADRWRLPAHVLRTCRLGTPLLPLVARPRRARSSVASGNFLRAAPLRPDRSSMADRVAQCCRHDRDHPDAVRSSGCPAIRCFGFLRPRFEVTGCHFFALSQRRPQSQQSRSPCMLHEHVDQRSVLPVGQSLGGFA